MSGRVVVLIGAARGIGAATARQLAARGDALVLADVDAAALAAVRAELARGGARVIAQVTDVRDMAALTRLRDRARIAFGRVDALVNFAAILRPGDLTELSPGAVSDQIHVNLVGAIHATQVFLPAFLERRRGHVVHVASLGGIVPLPHESVYSATKFGLRGFCHALALELRGTGVKVTVVSPDSVDTQQLALEAAHPASTLAFTSAALPADAVARAIARALDRPRLEVLVPGARGVLIKLLAFSPRLFWLLYPLLDRLGRYGQSAYQRKGAQPRAVRAVPQEARS